MKYSGKKLLILGSNVGSIDMIDYARKNGAYTIVADYLPKEQSEAKQHSDSYIMLSTADVDGLCDYVVGNHIDGVIAGISEFNLLQAMKVCQRCGLPFYCSKEQWDCIEDKGQFRSLCLKYDVPCPQTYYIGKNPADCKDYCFPIVVKPVDASSSIGVTICETEEVYRKAVVLAAESSKSGTVIIEEFFEGDEFTAHYSIADGVPTLVSVDNRYPVKINEGAVTSIPIARVYPSSFLEEYKRQINDNLIELCTSLKLEVGVFFVQGLYNKVLNKFCIFEAGLRSAGESPNRFMERVNGVNFLHNLVDFSLLGKLQSYDVTKEDPELKGKRCAVISYVAKGGKIAEIVGYSNIRDVVSSIVDSECRYHVGDIVPSGNTLRQIVLRFILVCDSIEQLRNAVNTINERVSVIGTNGKEMCLKFDPSLL